MMMAVQLHTKAPPVSIPTISSRGATSPMSSTEFSGGDTSKSVIIDDLVKGVIAPRQAPQLMEAVVEEVSSKHSAPRRVRSPQPIQERRPWGSSAAAASPRSRPASPSAPQTTSKVIGGTHARPVSTPRTETAIAPVRKALHVTSIPLKTASVQISSSKPRMQRDSTAATSPRPISKTPVVAQGPAVHARSQRPSTPPAERPQRTVQPQSARPLPEGDLAALMERMNVLESRTAAAEARALAAEQRASLLEAKLNDTVRDSESYQIATRQQFMHSNAQQQHLWELLRRMESYVLNAMVARDDELTLGTSSEVQVGGAQNTGSDWREAASVAARNTRYDADDSVARRLDLSAASNGSNSSTSRVPPHPPVELRQQHATLY